MGYRNILFDLDGTLIDPYAGISNSIKYALEKFNIQENDESRFKSVIGPPLEKSFMEFYGFDRDKTKTAVKYYREYYSEKGIYENELYENVDVLLREINGRGKKIMLATSKPKIFAERILKYFDIEKYFYDIAGSNMDGTLAEKDEIIKYVIEKNNLDKNETIMIGDRKYDVLGARGNTIHAAAVMYGYGSKEELEEAEPVYFCGSVMDILKIL